MSSLLAGDTLGGHLDDMEADWSKPIVSMRYPVNSLRLSLWALQRKNLCRNNDFESNTVF